jgi:hypothetical protein
MARASIATLLSLDRYAQIMGVNPVHFAGATAGDFFPLRNRCSDIWTQHSWQYADSVSREDLALAIDQAESDLAGKLGWWPAPRWTYQEFRPYPRHHRRDVYRVTGQNVRGAGISLHTRYARVIQAGQRATAPVGTASVAAGTLAYSDADGDGFAERATITLPTALTDAGEVKVYHAGRDAAPEWEIRNPTYRHIGSGSVTIRFWSWQMIDPDLWEFMPTVDNSGENLQAIDLSGLTSTPPVTTSLVQSVEVYREYTPTDQASVLFRWEPTPSNLVLDGFCSVCGGTGCAACAFTTQTGCLHVRDAERGVVVPEAATYDAGTGQWAQAEFEGCRDPDSALIWYLSGALDRNWLSGSNLLDPLPQKWANAIAWMATARLERPFCSCGNVSALGRKYQTDLAAVSATEKQAQSYNIDPVTVLQCPFGTRLGEVLAWQMVQNERGRVVRGGAV